MGAVGFDTNGNVLGGEEDYNDGRPFNFPDVTISAAGSSMKINQSTGTGTLLLATSETSLGPTATPGVETFAVQFINASHALITQFDGTATSSGSMDLQSATTESNFAFTISVTEAGYDQVAYGGVFTVSTGTISGYADVNDDAAVTMAPTPPATGNLTGSVTAKADAYGRGTATITINGVALSLVFYDVTPEVLRLIDMDEAGTTGQGSAAIGSAYGQMCPTSGCAFDSTALAANDVFGVEGDSWGYLYAETGSLTTSGSAVGTAGATISAGEGDAGWEGSVSSAASLTGTYKIATNGYGGATIVGLAPVTLPYGVYATSGINLLDPNNTSGTGGALVLDLYTTHSGGTGVIVPQASTTAATDLNNSYGFGAGQIQC